MVGDLGHDEATSLAASSFGTGNGAIPGYAPAPKLPAGPRVRTGKRATSQAQICLGVPALHRDHPDSWTLAVLNAVLGDGMSSRLFLSVREELGLAYDVSSGLVDYADAGALEVSAGVDPAGLPAALEAILVELARLRDEPVPEAELAKAKRYLAGGLELRMDDTRHVASWIGGQEALHDRVLTLDEALAAVEAVDAPSRPTACGPALPRRRPASCGCRPGALPARARRPPALAGMTAPPMTRTGPPPARTVELILARAHLRLGSLALARVELETLAGLGRLDMDGLVDLAEVRWRTGDLVGAGDAAAAALRDAEDQPVALLIASEAAAALGRPGEARRLAQRAMACATTSIDSIFAGMPRSGVWPDDADEPPPSAPTLFDRAPEEVAHPGAVVHDAPSSPAPAAPPPAPTTMGFWDDDDAVDPGPAELPDPALELEAARTALVAGALTEAALRFSLALRLAPALAPAVLEATAGARDPNLLMVRGDAYRLAGHEVDAREAYAVAASGGLPERRLRSRAKPRAKATGARVEMAAALLEGLDLDAPLRSEAPAAEGPATEAPDAHGPADRRAGDRSARTRDGDRRAPTRPRRKLAADELPDPHDAPRHDASG